MSLSTAEPAVGGFPPPIHPIVAEFQTSYNENFYDKDDSSASASDDEYDSVEEREEKKKQSEAAQRSRSG